MSKRRHLTDAIQSLGINKPFHLKNPNGIGLAPPKEIVPAQIESTQIEKTRSENAKIETAQKETTPNDITQKKHTQIEHAQNETSLAENTQKQLSRNEKTQLENAEKEHARKQQTHKEPIQFESARIEHVRSELGHTELAPNDPIALDGYFKIPHAIFASDVLRKLPGDTFRLYLWLCSRAWRFKDSTGSIRASRTYIEICTGMSIATISRGLSSLREIGLVTLLENNHKIGNLWQIQCERPWIDPNSGKGGGSRKILGTESTQNEHRASSNCASSVASLSAQPSQNEQEPTIPINSKNLSLNEPSVIFEYFRQLKPETKLQTERKRFLELKKSYTSQDIANCFVEVTSNPQWSSGSSIHSPMAFLCRAIPQVLAKVAETQRKTKRLSEIALQEELIRREEAEERTKDEAFFREAEKQFITCFPDPKKQEEMVEQIFLTLNYSIKPPVQFQRMISIRKWFEQNSTARLATG